MVITQGIDERKMGNRGSKSVYTNKSINVNEQRLDGSWCSKMHLRYSLMGFERNYQVKIPSKQITQSRFYTIVPTPSFSQLIEPWFFSGFSDAEGCFLITIRKDHKYKFGWRIEANFIINLHKRDLVLLNLLQTYLDGVGRISKERNNCYDYTVGSLEQIITKVIPHFDKYPLKTQKYSDYLLFKEVVIIMKNGGHLTKVGLQKIINIRSSINKGLNASLIEAFPLTIPLPRPLGQALVNSTKFNPQWIAGFTSGDGCFRISIRESKFNKAGSSVKTLFILTQHSRDELLLKSLINFFKCGHTYTYLNNTEFKCQSFKYNYGTIMPFFKKYPILGVKAKDFADWVRVIEMIQYKAHLTKEGFEQVRIIKEGMNKGRYLK